MQGDYAASTALAVALALIVAVLSLAVADRLYALYHLIAFRGLRRGQACGVGWTR
jgi:hypothetical protein